MRSHSFIFRYLKPFSGFLILNMLFSILSALFSVFSLVSFAPFLSLLFKDEVFTKSSGSASLISGLMENITLYLKGIIATQGKGAALIILAASMILFFLLKNIFLYLATWFMAPVRNGAVKNIRNDLYHKILILPLSFYNHHKKGDIISRISSDVQEVDEGIMKPIQQIVIDLFMFTATFAALFFISLKLTLFVMILLPISGIIISRVTRKLKRSAPKMQQRMGDLISQTEETLSGIRIIKAFNAIDFSRERYEKSNNLFTWIKNGVYRRTDLASPLSEFLGTIVVAIILVFGGSLILKHNSNLTPELFIAFLVLFVQAINPVKNLASAYSSIQKGKASSGRIKQLLAAEEIITEKENALRKYSFDHSIEFRNLSFSYEHESVLKNINLEIPKGKSVAIVGASGAGKSTMVDLIPRFYDCTEGELCIDSVSVKEYVISDVRALTGFVSQDTILFNDTVFNNIAFGLENVSEADIVEAARIANAHEFIVNLKEGYQTMIGDRGNKLSGGQRQRLSIARAVLRNSPILILDEATSALDTESERLVQDALEKIMKNRTTIAIAHRLTTIRNMDEIIVMDKGEIVERGTHKFLYESNGIYRKLCDMQNIA